MTDPASCPASCRLPPRSGSPCLRECQDAGACRATELLLVDGTRLVGRALGAVGETLRFRSLHPTRGPLLLPFADVEPLSLHGALLPCLPPGDAGALLGLARLAADGGLADEALRDLDRMGGDLAGLEEEVAALRARVREDAARRELEDARDHVAHRRTDHARAALDALLCRFPASLAAPEARVLRRTLATLAG